jgi:hypothetical protein
MRRICAAIPFGAEFARRVASQQVAVAALARYGALIIAVMFAIADMITIVHAKP